MRLVLLARCTHFWQQALHIVQPDTLLRWHRELFRRYWRRKSRNKKPKPRIPAETIALVKRMARENWLWGAERIRGELLKLGVKVSKRTIQKYIAKARQTSGQTWATFLKNHAGDIWACDFTVVFDLLFRPLYIFIIPELKTRRVVHIATTSSPTDVWTAQQLREATPWGEAPKYLNQFASACAGHQAAVCCWKPPNPSAKRLDFAFEAPVDEASSQHKFYSGVAGYERHDPRNYVIS